MEAITPLLQTIDAAIAGFVESAFISLAPGIHNLWRLMLIAMLGFFGYRTMLQGDFAAHELFVKLFKAVIILALATEWGNFMLFVYDVTTNLPAEVAAPILGNLDSDRASVIEHLDFVAGEGFAVASSLWAKATLSNFSLYLYGGIVWGGTFLLTLYAVMLIALAKIASAVLLAVAPFFIVLLMFRESSGLFEGWMRALLSYSLIPLFVYVVLALLLMLVSEPLRALTEQVAHTDAVLAHYVPPYALATFVSFLLLMQITGLAGGVAGGVSLQTMSGFGKVLNFGRNLTDGGYAGMRNRSLGAVRRHYANNIREPLRDVGRLGVKLSGNRFGGKS